MYLGQRAKERRLPSPEPAPQFDFVDHLLTTFHNIEPYLEMIMGHIFKIFQLGWRRTGRALSKIAPVAEKGLIMELEDEGSTDWGNVAQQNWNRRAAMYQKNVRKVAQATTRVVRKGAKTGRGFPFTGRKSSALGTLSVVEALKVMSMESLVATKRKNDALMAGIADSKMCKFVSKDL